MSGSSVARRRAGVFPRTIKLFVYSAGAKARQSWCVRVPGSPGPWVTARPSRSQHSLCSGQGTRGTSTGCTATMSAATSSAPWRHAMTPTTNPVNRAGIFQAKATKSGNAAMV